MQYPMGVILITGATDGLGRALAERLAEALPENAEVSEPDEIGVFEVELDADDREDSLMQIWNAVAASGTDDHVVFLEHPDLPDHWRPKSGAPQR